MKYLRWGGWSGDLTVLHPAVLCSWIVPMDDTNSSDFYTVCWCSTLPYYHKALLTLETVLEQKDDNTWSNNLSLNSKLQGMPSILCKKWKWISNYFLGRVDKSKADGRTKQSQFWRGNPQDAYWQPCALLATGAWLKGWAGSSCSLCLSYWTE